MSDKDKKIIIQVKNLTKNYGELRAVQDVSFNVFEGEIFGLLGPNGAGKTTTLEIIETLRDETSGEVFIDGYSINKDQEEIKKIIGVQLQQAGFYPNLTLVEILRLFADLYGASIDPLEILKLVNLEDKAKAKYDKMSGGQKQRFSIATTLINQPRVVFLDEPTTGLDPQARRNLWDLIKNIRAQGTTVVLTTHYMDEAEVLCDRIAIMDKGKIIALDSPDELINSLLRRGFQSRKEIKPANLEDVFLDLTGKEIRDL
jgi:ABC-2 type transport system ATP-binding protein